MKYSLFTTLPTLSSVAALSLAGPALAQNDLKEIPDPTPQFQLDSFEVADGFEISLFASDPMIAKPVQMNWDAQGRLWLVSSKLYPQIIPGQEADDEILVIEDTDRDGKADKKTVFADGLLIPTGVMPGDGGAYVANSTELLFMKDTDGDGRADHKQVMLSGFGTEDTHHIIHTFRGGPEGLLYFNQSIYIHSHIETPHGVRRLLGGGIWHLRPETQELSVYCEGFVNTWGHVHDRWGQSFATDGAYGEGINYVFPGSVFVTAPGAKRWMSGLNSGQPKHCGLGVVSGHHLPEEWAGHMITNDFRGHRVNRFELTEEGSGYVSRQQEDLVRTSHGAFRPIDVQMGPDGAIYIADWYNPIIQHGEVDFRDERRDHVHGRIWRVSKTDSEPLPYPEIVGAPVEKLLEHLTAPEDWTRHHAKRELRERGAEVVTAPLKEWVAQLDSSNANSEHHRLEALWVSQSLNELNEPLLRELLVSADHRIRSAAVRVLYHWPRRLDDTESLLSSAIDDPHPRVRLEAIHALRQVGTGKAFEVALRALNHPMDKNLDFALWAMARALESSWLSDFQSGKLTLGGNSAAVNFALKAIENPEALTPILARFESGDLTADQAEEAMQMIAEIGRAEELEQLFAILLKPDADSAIVRSGLSALSQTARNREVVPSGDLTRVTSLVESGDPSVRERAIETAGLWKVEEARPTLVALIENADSSGPIVNTSIVSLGNLGGAESRSFLETFAKGGADLSRRVQAATALVTMNADSGAAIAADLLAEAKEGEKVNALFDAILQRQSGPDQLATALEGKEVAKSVAYLGLQKANASGNDAAKLVEALTSAADLDPINQALSAEEMAQLLMEVRDSGNPAHGEMVYRRESLQCMVCHALGGAGGVIGPDMISLGASAPGDYIVESLLEPNKKIKEGFHMTVVHTKDGGVYSGFLTREDDKEVVIRDAAGAATTLPADQVESKTITPVSLMPPGLTASLRRDEFVDLVRFLSELGKEGDYKIGTERFVRTWRVLPMNDAIEETVRQGDQRFFAEPDDLKVWNPAYSTVSGKLPLSDVPNLQRWLVPLSVVQFDVTLSSAGPIGLQLNTAEGIRAWAGTEEITVPEDGKLQINLPAGIHTVTLTIDRNAVEESISVELLDVERSEAKASLTSASE